MGRGPVRYGPGAGPQSPLPPRGAESGARFSAHSLHCRIATPLMEQEALLNREAASKSGQGAVRAHDSMSRDDDSQGVGAHRLPYGPGCAGPAD